MLYRRYKIKKMIEENIHATQVFISQVVQIESLCKMIGYCSVQTIQIYTKITN